MKSKQGFHKEAEAINEDITQATQYGKQQYEKRHKGFWDFDVRISNMRKAFCCYLIARREQFREIDFTKAARTRN